MRLLPIAAPVAASLALVATSVMAEAPGPAVPSGNAVTSVTGTFIDAAGNRVGNVQLHQATDGTVKIIADATLIPSGAHGIHVHGVGVCEPAGKFASAGGHFNPGGRQHGLNNPAGSHAGDLPQIDGKSVEQGYYTATTKAISLTSGPTSIFDADGTALVIHMSADDQVTDPTGNSGDRIACAVLAAPNPALATPTASATPRPPTAGIGTSEADGTSRTVAIAAAFAMAAGAFVAGVRRFAR